MLWAGRKPIARAYARTPSLSSYQTPSLLKPRARSQSNACLASATHLLNVLESRQSNTEPIDDRRNQVHAVARVIPANVRSAEANRSAPREIRVSRAPLQPPLHAVSAHKTAAPIPSRPQDGFPSDRDQHAAATTPNSDTMRCHKNRNLLTLGLHNLI